MLPKATPPTSPTSPTSPPSVFFVCVDDDADFDTVAAAVVSVTDTHYAEVDRIAAQAAAAAENEGVNESITAALAAVITKTDDAESALISEEDVKACVMPARDLATKLAADAKAKLPVQNKAVALEHMRAAAATQTARAQQQTHESADRDAESDRKLRE